MTAGSGPVLGFDAAGAFSIIAAATEKVADVTGAGDALAGATIAALLRGLTLRAGACAKAMAAAMLAIESAERRSRLHRDAASPRRWPLCRRPRKWHETGKFIVPVSRVRWMRRTRMEIQMTPETARPFIDIHAPVAQALAAGRPVVALESTIITHGMPYPDNGAMAANVEKIIGEGGAVPATIAVVGGRIKIGLSDGERESLAMTGDAMKLSRADLGFAVAQGRTGGTTVAATMIAAHMVGIKVFATGGIGGVHKGAEKSFDISADLDELARTPVIVVSAGAKAILDIEKTLEVLETRGVPVVGHGSETSCRPSGRGSRRFARR